MATHDYVIDNSTGANVRADINNVLQAILTNNSSSSAPSTTAAYMWWADTTNGVLKIRNSSDNAWVELLQLDGTLTLEDGSVSTPALAFRDDLNTGIYSSAADTFNVATGGVERMELGATTIFNESGADVDFRIEGDSQANLFYVDAGNDRIGIGTSSPLSALHVRGSGTTTLRVDNSDDGTASLTLGNTGSSNLVISQTNANATFSIGGSERIRIDSSGKLLVGTSTARSPGTIGAFFQIEGTTVNTSSVSATRNSADNAGANFVFNKTRGTSIGSDVVVNSGDQLGIIRFCGNDGTDSNNTAGSIQCEVDGTPGANDMPGRLVFSTTADGANSSTERLRIDSSGKVGIGTTSVKRVLHINSADAIIALCDSAAGTDLKNRYIESNDGHMNFGLLNDAFNSASPHMRIDSNGDLAIGSTTNGGANRLLIVNNESGDFADGSDAALRITNSNASNDTRQASIAFTVATTGSGSDGAIVCTSESGGNSNLRFFTDTSNGLTEKLRIDSSGNKILNDTFDLSGSGRKSYFSSTGQQYHGRNAHETYIVFQDTSNTQIGGIVRGAGASVAYNTTSDYRLKENVVDLTNAITRLKTLSPKRFNFKSHPSITMDGFLAHEVTAVPEAIEGEKDGVITQAMLDAGTLQGSVGDPIYQGIDQSKLVPLLVAAVQELITKVETLETA